MKRKAILEANRSLNRLSLRDLEYGDIINLSPGRVAWWNLPLQIAHRAIIRHQKKIYGGDRIYSVHSWFYIFLGQAFEVAPPRARFIDIDLDRLDPHTWYVVCRYKDHRITTAEEREIIWEAMQELKGTTYDYGQLVAIALNRLLGWPVDKYLPLFDFGRQKKVCSVLARVLWMVWWREFAKPKGLPARRPGGRLHVERTSPALFENEETFEVVGVLDGGAARLEYQSSAS